MKRYDSMRFPFRWMNSLNMLDDEDFRLMVNAIITYAQTGETPCFYHGMACAFQEFRQCIDEERQVNGCKRKLRC